MAKFSKNKYSWQRRAKELGLTFQYRIPLGTDSSRMLEEILKVQEKHSTVPNGARFHTGGWQAYSLYSWGGDPMERRRLSHIKRDIFEQTGKKVSDKDISYEKTPILKECPYIESFLDTFPCEKQRVRASIVMPGERIDWHQDTTETPDLGIMRLHVPIQYVPESESQICHEHLKWKPNEVWVGDFSFPHRVINRGSVLRINLMADLIVNKDVIQLLPDVYHEQKDLRRAHRRELQGLYRKYARKQKNMLYYKEGLVKDISKYSASESNSVSETGETG